MSELKQEPITMTEKQLFASMHKVLLAGSFSGEAIVAAANMIIFCERIAQADELKDQDAPAPGPKTTLGPDAVKVVP